MTNYTQEKSPAATGEGTKYRWVLFNKFIVPEPASNCNDAVTETSANRDRSQIMTPLMAMKTMRDYVCATCWSHLNSSIAEGGYRVVCARYGAEHAGFVTKSYADNRRSESIGESYEVRRLLHDLGVVASPHAGKSASQLISELGYEED